MMEKEDLITIGEAASRLGVSLNTLRRWDESGKLPATRKSPGGDRYYSEKDLDILIHDEFKLAYEWAVSDTSTEIPEMFYCPNSAIFQGRLMKMQALITKMPDLQELFSLVVAVTGEIGNNSFDHNLGNWPDVAGVFFGYNVENRSIVLADRGLGILKTLQRVRPQLDNHKDALQVAFTEIISGRSPEERGNGLKFVRNVVAANPISLVFQSGDYQLEIEKETSNLDIKRADKLIRGCIALIKF
ncbi:MAG: hypothetical protein A3B23_03195 [Candidatus Colwellbacteria bacterium RIFCSPLOWO2_01_FULL_48_10]|uniref:HTH merR-type domain-containing protein n=2 Tax=Bacteria candidate phyla TaxID=1783234 RepID=A0A1F5NZC0_9BACT|nr:MAG: hypothetical protein A2846_02405 [Candidatus Doudnabacteria bacterium RIFCSPHIGHO2_01_FULL_49_9]OGY59657.1 MAG: hypothetical protein A3B23_03195 [Candidatus Colwellbacteria bacterium RIFCSPLOWO2_01_FULL_48_10]